MKLSTMKPLTRNRSTIKRMSALLGLCMIVMLDFPAVGRQTESELDTSTLDRATRIQDDLFQHVNGTWLKNTPIPADKSDYGSFGQLADLSQKRIRELIENLATGQYEPGSDEQKVGDFYQSFIDEAAVEARGLEPL